MLLELKETVQRTLEVKTPSHYKFGGFNFLKIVEGKALHVTVSSEIVERPKIEVLLPEFSGGMYLLFINEGQEITPDEFNEAYCKAHNEMAEIQLQKNPMADLFTT